ncbi:adhesion G protein-coupled receptor B2 [Trichonephila clavipes]|nr:adhesion G protein-coupled receptor B2 [Trichonephila clavipes]
MIWRESGTAYRPENIEEKDRYPTCSIVVWAGIMINGRTRLHVVANGTMTGQRYIDEVLLPQDVLGRQVAGRNYQETNKNTLIRALTEEWDKLPQQLLDHVVQSMVHSTNAFRRDSSSNPETDENHLVRDEDCIVDGCYCNTKHGWFLPPKSARKNTLVALYFKYDFRHMTATAGSGVVKSGRPIFDDFFQHLWPCIGNNTANVVFQMVKRLWLIRIDQ